MTTPTTLQEPRDLAPQLPPLHPLRWVKENLFSSVWSSILTLAVGAVVVGFLYGLLNFVFAEGRQWNSIGTNSRFYGTFAYPTAQYARVWVALGIVVVLVATSLAAWGARPRIPVVKLTRTLVVIGALVALVAVLAPWSASARVLAALLGLALAIPAYGVGRATGLAGEGPQVPLFGVLGAIVILGLAALWLLPEVVGVIEISTSTKAPLTNIAAIGFVAYALGQGVVSRISRSTFQALLSALWVLSLPLIYLAILRDPAFDFSVIRTQDVPIALVLVAAGGWLIWVVSAPQRRNVAGLAGGIVLVLAIAVWFPPLNEAIPWIKARVPLALLAAFLLAAPSFGGSHRARRILAGAWVGTELVAAYFLAVGQAGTSVEVQTDLFGGILLTLVLAFAGIILAFPLGVLLALGRTSTMPIFRLLSTGYIEAIRGVPLITILFFGSLFLPLFVPPEIRVDRVLRAVIAIALFSAAYLAENVRGGLQSIRKGQYEAARAVGMTTVQMTLFITLPQALRAVIPAIVGQIISLFKDTSLVFIIGLSEILAIAARLVPGQPEFIGSQRENLLFVALVYWVFTFSFSRASQRLEKKLGLGER